MAAWFFFSLLLPFALIFLFRHNLNIQKIRKLPPGPSGLPFIGNLHQFDSAKPHEFLTKLSKKYGPLMSLRLGTVPVLVISSAKTAKEALKIHDLIFSGRPPLVSHQKLSYNGLDVAFSPYSEHWREMRKVSVLQLLSLKKVQSFRPVLEDEISLLVKKISNLSSSQLINLSSMTMNLTSTVICRIAFGKKYGEGSHDKKRFDQILHESEAMFAGFFVSDYFPSLSWIDNLSGMFGRLEKNFRDLDLFYQQLIEDHLDSNRADTMKNDILDTLIQIKDEQSSSFDLTWDHIKAMLMDVFIAGTGTSAASIVWTMTALMKAPSAMKRVQAEIRELVGKNKGAITEEVLQKLPYLDSVIKETFRLYPIAPLLVPRETTANCSIEGYHIEAKTMVFINVWAIGRDPETWEKAEDFIPERFFNSKIDVRGNDFELIPFGAGRRGCPGLNLGMSTVKVALANLLCSFDWELPVGMKMEDIDTDMSPGITMHKKNPLCLVAKKYA